MQLIIDELTKTYPNGTRALDKVSLRINKGMFGLLGPNGAGKSTLMRTIATLQQPDSGRISFRDIDVLQQQMKLRKELGYLPQEFGVYPRISAERLLDYLAQLKGVSASSDRKKLIDYCLEITNLQGVRKKAVSGYSGGMKQRFGIAQLLLNHPKLIIVDEPTAGLDPAERQRFLNILREIGKENIVIFSTHIVEDIKDLCTDMAVMNAGTVLDHITPLEALKKLEGKIYVTNLEEKQLAQLEQDRIVLSSSYNSDHSIKARIYAIDPPGEGFELSKASLEDYYFTTLKLGNV